MDKATLKAKVCEAIDRRADEIIGIGRHLLRNPELGYKEHKGSALVAEKFKALGLEYQAGLALTGVRTELAGKSSGPTVAVLGELDALICHDHPAADPHTGAAHTCGHNAQVAAMLGAGMAILDTQAMSHLAGRVVLFAVPAEEYVEIEYREKLQQAGQIELFGGKAELIRLGGFDDIDMAMLVHSVPDTPGRKFLVGATTNGFLVKTIRFRGRASHAGARPDYGVNALNAAALAMMGINAQRETFREEDCIRVHYILTKGGELVNVVPDDARIEMFVRGKTVESILDASAKVDRSLRGAAAMVGAEVIINDQPGYLPMWQESAMTASFRENAATLVGAGNVFSHSHVAASTDMGDLSHLIPVLHPGGGGFEGINHASNFLIADEEMAYLMPAKAMAMTVIDLLYGEAELARRAIEEFQPRMTREQYLGYLRGDHKSDY